MPEAPEGTSFSASWINGEDASRALSHGFLGTSPPSKNHFFQNTKKGRKQKVCPAVPTEVAGARMWIWVVRNQSGRRSKQAELKRALRARNP